MTPESWEDAILAHLSSDAGSGPRYLGTMELHAESIGDHIAKLLLFGYENHQVNNDWRDTLAKVLGNATKLYWGKKRRKDAQAIQEVFEHMFSADVSTWFDFLGSILEKHSNDDFASKYRGDDKALHALAQSSLPHVQAFVGVLAPSISLGRSLDPVRSLRTYFSDAEISKLSGSI